MAKCTLRAMANQARQQRQTEPVPPGRYWNDFNGPQVKLFDQWIRDMDGAAVVEHEEREERNLDASALFSSTVPFLFVIWTVPEGRAPFYPKQLGFPNFAPNGEVHRKADIIDLGPESTLTDVARDQFPAIDQVPEAARSLGAGIGLAALAVIVLVALRR